MLTPAAAIQELDAALREAGQIVTLRRGPKADPVATVTVMAHVRGFRPDELIGGINQNDSKVILSPTGLGDFIPKEDDWIEIDGSFRSVLAVGLVRMADTLVRIEMTVKG